MPKGKLFNKDISNDKIVEYAKEVIGYPVVLKPSNAAQGKGVIANIENEEFLKKSLKHVREELGYREVILEEHVFGEEYRVYVMQDEVIAVLNRVPANVIGNGKSTIKQLIQEKNKQRKKNPRLYSSLIKVDFEIENLLIKTGLTLNSIPNKDEIIYLRQKSNVSSGGDPVDVTDEFPEEVKQVAISALKQIPDFPNGGVDIMVDFNKPLKEATKVIELTPVPQIGSLVFPTRGKGRDIPSAIIDYYFPDTKHLKNSNPNIYFYLPEILAPLMSKSASEITVIPCPDFIETQKKYIIEGTVQGVGFRRWIRKKALEADLYGYAENQLNGSLVVAVAGRNDTVKAFEKVCRKGPKKAIVTKVSAVEWDGALRVGFQIKPNPKGIKKEQNKINTNNTHKQKNNTNHVSIIKRVKRKVANVLR